MAETGNPTQPATPQDNSDNAKEPERLELPDNIFVIPQEKPLEEPFSEKLKKDRFQSKTSFKENRRTLRLERIKKIEEIRNSKLLVYYSIDTLDRNDSDVMFEILQSIKKKDRLDLFLLSPGGYADPALKMAQILRSFSGSNLGVLVPSYAKSAATLLLLGSDELVMGVASEIGPTDPRIEITDEDGRKMNVSAQSIEEALDIIENKTRGNPLASAKYMPLLENINLKTLGEYSRALKSSKQIAETLLKGSKLLKRKNTYKSVSKSLAEGYYSHAYPINNKVADEIGLKVTTPSDDLWESMWQLHLLYNDLIYNSKDGKTMITSVFEGDGYYAERRKLLEDDN